jgi:murein DD-endopeptidase MepM/ murein hydrolase activator NlpD
MNYFSKILYILKIFFSTISKYKVFLVYLVLFVVLSICLIKFTYTFLSRKLPVQEEIILPIFKPNDLVVNLNARLSYLISHTSGVSFRVYKVKMKDNLWKVSKNNGYSVHTIIGCNPQLETYEVGYNQKIILPSKAGTLHIFQKDDSLQKIAKRYDTSMHLITKFNPYIEKLSAGEMVFIPDRRPDISLLNDAMKKKYELRSLFTSPLGGRLSSTFGMRRHPVTGLRSLHGGIDIAVKEGTWVGAAASGVVILASYDVGHYGTAIFIDHGNGYITHYGHLSKIFVHVGQRVKARQLIAKSGSTGRSTGPHLHFTIKKNDVSIDPLKFIW